MSKPPRQVRCPQCGGTTPWSPENPWRPFCSERCKQIDLGAWASERYSIAGQTDPDALDAMASDLLSGTPADAAHRH